MSCLNLKQADWRDSLSVSMLTSDHVDPHELPVACRYLLNYQIWTFSILYNIFVITDSLDLRPDHLRRAMESWYATTTQHT
ncbi:hypothetical protein ACOSQ4_006939 [Xanthoceras sorbifolium]